MLYNIICAIVVLCLWWGYKYNIIKNFFTKIFSEKTAKNIDKLTRHVIDLLPMVLLIKYHTPIAIMFLVGCYLADKLINSGIGAIIFFVVYSLTSLSTVYSLPINYTYVGLSIFIITNMLIYVATRYETNLLIKIGGIIYAYMALNLCMYASLMTCNAAFACLVVGDFLLAMREVAIQKHSNKERIVYTISNSFYYLGVCFVPLALI